MLYSAVYIERLTHPTVLSAILSSSVVTSLLKVGDALAMLKLARFRRSNRSSYLGSVWVFRATRIVLVRGRFSHLYSIYSMSVWLIWPRYSVGLMLRTCRLGSACMHCSVACLVIAIGGEADSLYALWSSWGSESWTA